MLIMAVASAVAFPAVRAGARQREVRRTMQHFVSNLRWASSKAILLRRPAEIWIAPDDGEYCRAVRAAKPSPEGDEESGEFVTFMEKRRREAEEAESIVAPGREEVKCYTLPEIASFGEVEGGRFLAAEREREDGRFRAKDVIRFDFYPNGGSSGGRIPFEFQIDRDRQEYVMVINPLISSVSIEEEE
jgi:hypothetical protein